MHPRRIISFAALAFVWAAPAPAPADETPALEYVVVAANTGNSAGGHSGLRVGDEVYHYQAGDDMILLLRRVSWSHFTRRYAMLDNRRIMLSRLDLSETSAQTIVAHLDRLRVIQHEYVDRLEALKVENAWFAALSGTEKKSDIPLPAVGLFDLSSRDDPGTLHLKNLVASSIDAGFLNRELLRVTNELSTHALHISEPGETLPVPDQFPAIGTVPAEQLRERLLLREALLTLTQGRGLASNTLVAPDLAPLTPAERTRLNTLKDRLQSSVIRLLQSPRPDRGAPLLLATARLNAIRRSLDDGHWLLLDATPRDTVLITAKKAQKNRELIEALAAQAGETWQGHRAKAAAKDSLSAAEYGRLEDAASRVAEPLAALREKRDVWAAGLSHLVPVRRGSATPLALPAVSHAAARAAHKESSQHLARYEKNLRKVYEFSLLGHNCTTEIAGAIQAAFPDKATAAAALGAYIPPRNGFAFIPIKLADKIEKNWNITSTRVIPSWRHQQINQLAAHKSRPALLRLRESNTLTASYPGSIYDSTFLFFADGKTVLRPFQGAANIAYGALNTGIGAVTFPFDGGHRTWNGLRGAFYSIPELAGISIRKGRYDIVPTDAKLSAPSEPGD